MLRVGEPREVGMDVKRIQRLAERVSEWTEKGLTQSVTYLVARRGIVVARNAFGVATYLDPGRRLDTNAVFGIASASKPITATAIMQLVESGALSLNRPLVEYMPEVSGDGAQAILVHHLLTHTSGYTVRGAAPRLREAYAASRSADRPVGKHELIQELLKSVYDLDPEVPAGTEHIYCGIVNYLFLAEIVRRVSGKTIDEYSRTNIFEPLGMKDSSYGLSDAISGRRVVPDPEIYRGIQGYDPNDPVRLALPHGGGGMFSTIDDLAIFVQTFLNGGTYACVDLLSPASVEVMTTNQIPGIGTRDQFGTWIPEAPWGLGWMVQGATRERRAHGTLQPVGSFYHQGASGAAIWAEPRSGLACVYLSVISRMDPTTEEFYWEFDKFQNMVMSCLQD